MAHKCLLLAGLLALLSGAVCLAPLFTWLFTYGHRSLMHLGTACFAIPGLAVIIFALPAILGGSSKCVAIMALVPLTIVGSVSILSIFIHSKVNAIFSSPTQFFTDGFATNLLRNASKIIFDSVYDSEGCGPSNACTSGVIQKWKSVQTNSTLEANCITTLNQTSTDFHLQTWCQTYWAVFDDIVSQIYYMRFLFVASATCCGLLAVTAWLTINNRRIASPCPTRRKNSY